MNKIMKPNVQAFFDPATYTISYVVFDSTAKRAAIIDSVLDFDRDSGTTKTDTPDQLISFIEENQLTVHWILETHAHADHLSAAPYLKSKLGGRTGIGSGIVEVQKIFSSVFNTDESFHTNGDQFDHLFEDGEDFTIGELTGVIMHTPGHTPACVTYVIGDTAFVGDTLFMPDFGTARTDFPGGDAATLYQSIHKIFELPGETRLFMCHDYKAPGRNTYAWETTVAEERERNIHVKDGITEPDFIAMRTARDETLSVPQLLLPSVQVNMRAGELPPPEDNGVSYLKLPVNAL